MSDDFTKADAAAWVKQEFAKVDVDNAMSRANSEKNMLDWIDNDGDGDDYPNDRWAHETLLARVVGMFKSRVPGLDALAPVLKLKGE